MLTEVYNSDRDYRVVLQAAKEHGSIAIAPIATALIKAGIQWNGLQGNDPATGAIDRDILRAWDECGYKRLLKEDK